MGALSRVECLNLRALRARLLIAAGQEWAGSIYVLALGACLLACDPRSIGELQMLDAIYRQQCDAEAIEADLLLDALAEVVS